MSSRATQVGTPSLVLVVKRLAREWRSLGEDANTGMNGVKPYLDHPIRTLVRLIERSTSFPASDMEWAAWYSDRPLERTPPKEPGDAFFPLLNDPEIDGLLEDFATGDCLQHLRLIHDELNKCDADGRTITILNQLETEIPGTLGHFGFSSAKNDRSSKSKRPHGRPRRSEEWKARQKDIAERWTRFYESKAWQELRKIGQGTAKEQFCSSEGIDLETLETALRQNRH
jgi:hypothetical protein